MSGKQIKKMIFAIKYGSCCIWCKKEDDSDNLTIEHIVRHEDYRKNVLGISCRECNTLHGNIMERFSKYSEGAIGKDSYFCTIRRLHQMYTNRYNAIINNSWFQLSLNAYRDNSKFKHNPSNVNLINDTCSTYKTIIEQQDAYFIPSEYVHKSIYRWQVECLQSHS